MHIDVVNFTGHENTCTINYYDHKGDYVRTYILEDLETELCINLHGKYSVRIKSCKFVYFDELCKKGEVRNPKLHEVKKMESQMCECVNWDEWELNRDKNIDDFMLEN